MPYDVITIGSATRDVFLVSDDFQLIRSDKFSTGIGECVSLGTKIEIDTIVHTTGGGATNAAATFSSLGFRTAAICRIGDDRVGGDVVADLKEFGVATSFVRRVRGGQTGYSTLLTAKNGERTVLVHRGVSSGFSSADVPLSRCKTKWFYITSLAGNLALVKRVVQFAKKNGIKVAWNPGHGELSKGIKAVRPILPHIALFNLNREEAEKLTGNKNLIQNLKTLSEKGNIAIITDGTKGSHACHNGDIVYSGTTGAKSISRTGAGDAFGSATVAGLMKGRNLEEALAIGTINAESVIQKHGAKIGILKKWPAKSQTAKIPIKYL